VASLGGRRRGRREAEGGARGEQQRVGQRAQPSRSAARGQKNKVEKPKSKLTSAGFSF
jgi:hypothetical protein